LEIDPQDIEVKSVEAATFPDASLGVHEPDLVYVQVITPGFVIDLTTAGKTYRYHASDDRVVALPDADRPPISGRIAINEVQVSSSKVTIRGSSTLPDGICLNTELWADGVPQVWWPDEACALINVDAWELEVTLKAGESLSPGVAYMVRAFMPGGPDIVAVFPFDLTGPPTQSP
jgi:hypothetical protein